MNRNLCLSAIGLFFLSIAGCGHDTTPPARPVPDVPDAELQLMDENEQRDREVEAQAE